MTNSRLVRSLFMAIVLLAVQAAALVTVPSLYAAEGGGSHYSPGFYGDFGVATAPDPGFYLRNDLYYYKADASGERIVQFGELRADLEVDVAMYMLTGLMALEKDVLGGRYAFGALLPVLYSDISANIILGPLTASVEEDRTAIGDPGIIPISLFWNIGNFHINASETITAPIGSYDKERNVNAGLNYWSFDTVLAATYLNPERGHEISAIARDPDKLILRTLKTEMEPTKLLLRDTYIDIRLFRKPAVLRPGTAEE